MSIFEINELEWVIIAINLITLISITAKCCYSSIKTSLGKLLSKFLINPRVQNTKS